MRGTGKSLKEISDVEVKYPMNRKNDLLTTLSNHVSDEYMQFLQRFVTTGFN